MKRTAEPPSPEVGKVLAALERHRRRAGLSKEELGRRLGWTGDYVRRILGGRIGLHYEHVTEILAALGVHPAEFFAEVHGELPGRRRPAGAGLAPHDPGGRLVHRSGLYVFVEELRVKGFFTAEEAARLVEKLDELPPPRED